jgi:hypothetical protein
MVEFIVTANVALLKLSEMAAAFGLIETPRRLNIIGNNALAETSLFDVISYYLRRAVLKVLILVIITINIFGFITIIYHYYGL